MYWMVHAFLVLLSVHKKKCSSFHEVVFSPTSQSAEEQVTDVPVTCLISKTNQWGCVELNYIPTAFFCYREHNIPNHTSAVNRSANTRNRAYTIINIKHWNSFRPVNKKGPSSWRNPFSLETIEIAVHFYQAAFEHVAPEAIVIISASIVTRVIATNRLIETAKPALAHSQADTQLHLRVWLALIKHL